jgi:hypothetical protein
MARPQTTHRITKGHQYDRSGVSVVSTETGSRYDAWTQLHADGSRDSGAGIDLSNPVLMAAILRVSATGIPETVITGDAPTAQPVDPSPAVTAMIQRMHDEGGDL